MPQARAGYVFALSASDSSPDSTLSQPANGPRNLHLWLKCGDAGLSAFEARLISTMTPLAFTPVNEVINVGSTTDLQLAVPGCPTGMAHRLGYWTVIDNGGTACLTTSSGSGRMAAVDCQANPEVVLFPRIEGFSSTGEELCLLVGNTCGANIPNQGLVIGYGQVLSPPFEFTTPQGGDGALYLNGMQYYPQLGGVAEGKGGDSESSPDNEAVRQARASREATVLDENRKAKEVLRVATREALAAGGQAGLAERLVELLRHRPEVHKVAVSTSPSSLLDIWWNEPVGREVVSESQLLRLANGDDETGAPSSEAQPEVEPHTDPLEPFRRANAIKDDILREAGREALSRGGVEDFGVRLADILRRRPEVIRVTALESENYLIGINWGKLGGREVITERRILELVNGTQGPPVTVTTPQPDLSSLFETRIQQFWHLLAMDQGVYFGETAFVLGGDPSATARLARALRSGRVQLEDVIEADRVNTVLGDSAVLRDIKTCRANK